MPQESHGCQDRIFLTNGAVQAPRQWSQLLSPGPGPSVVVVERSGSLRLKTAPCRSGRGSDRPPPLRSRPPVWGRRDISDLAGLVGEGLTLEGNRETPGGRTKDSGGGGGEFGGVVSGMVNCGIGGSSAVDGFGSAGHASPGHCHRSGGSASGERRMGAPMRRISSRRRGRGHGRSGITRRSSKGRTFRGGGGGSRRKGPTFSN